MKTPAVISALTVVGSLAFAAGQSQTVRVIPDEEKPLEGEMPPMMAMGETVSCLPYPAETWFAPGLRQIRTCVPQLSGVVINSGLWRSIDVNSDGSIEVVKTFQIGAVSGGQPTVSACVVVSRLTTTAEGLSESQVSVLSTQQVGEAILEQFPNAVSAFIGAAGLRDMDDDGDLDYVFGVDVRFSDSPMTTEVRWLENIGYEKPDPPLAADINQDGAVNGDDLGMLLAAWTIP
jgi:hypothetical protein